MCGIVGYIGPKQAAPILLDGLSRLEYRGYDSAGLAVRDGEAEPAIVKAKGRLKILEEKTNGGHAMIGTCGIGHTRWATHGEPSEGNAHPHCTDDRSIIGVHNGIIENYQELKEKLLRKGYTFMSQTDTEVAVKLVDYYYKKDQLGPLEAIAHSMMRIRGSYALVLMFRDFPGELFAARKDSPMIIGVEDGETYLASDVPAILRYTRNVYYIGNSEIARISAGNVTFYNIDQEEISKELTEIKWDAESAEKGGFEHFMMKEIHEQPKAVLDTYNSIVKNGEIVLEGISLSEEEIKGISDINIVACGSAYHIGISLQYVIEKLARIPVRVELGSEFRYRDPILSSSTLVIVISQSGETADSLAALREAKDKGARTLGIVNVIGSTIAREADDVLYTLAGPEIAVATTKAYSTQLIAGYLLAIKFAFVRGLITKEQMDKYLEDIAQLPDKITRVLELEGSLKMKEISYIHSEGYAAGELKHGTISLIEDGTLVIGVVTQPDLYEKTVSNMVEVKSRGAYLMGLTTYGQYNIEDTANFTVYVPKTDPLFANSLAIVSLQLLAYYISVAKGLDVDKPRNLAKSVTVE